MIRGTLMLICLGLNGSFAVAFSQELPVAPMPREVHRRDTAATMNRILENSQTITDRLARGDTGDDTQQLQDENRMLLESLLEPPPPPPSGGMGEPMPMDEPNSGKDKKDEPMPMTSDTEPKKGGNSDMPQKQEGKDPNAKKDPMSGMPPMDGKMPDKPDAKDPGGSDTQPPKKPDPKMGKGNDPKLPEKNTPKDPNDSKDPKAGGSPTGGVPKDPMNSKLSIPLDDDVVKEVWGSPRDRMRIQVSQYYNERFMPKYSDLLKLYYSSLANTSPKTPPMPLMK